MTLNKPLIIGILFSFVVWVGLYRCVEALL